MMESEEQSAAEEGDCCSWLDPTAESSTKSVGDRRRKRFSEEQIKSLESMFETQTKLEPRQKLQMARELGLQPRQVAIWFQNKRARWKSKQLEREYRGLKADYDALLASFESLKKEKQALLNQLHELAELIEKTEDRSNNRDGDGASNDRDAESKQEQRNRQSFKEEQELEFAVYAEEEDKKLSYFSEDEPAMCAGQPATSCLTSSAEQQFCFTTSWPSDQSCSNSQWWEFWPLSE
ncbi:hypothetical protein Cni_G03880 [Canna indica]|uniref:Homeobox-leucine zipper protein n=1 Tax=Canna indica TaxID=4628 RepID=A0AAQ3JTF6_9LILI|nr:hypothetical protein Cni_G03880 [Canna indica]